MIAWVLTGVGSIFLALSFANLGSKIPRTGGPYEYSKLAFGDFAGFMNAWLYWNGSWIGNAAVITAIASYTGSLILIVNNNHLVAFLYTSAILWIFTIINIMRTKKAGVTQTAITIFELLLFIFFIGVTAYHFNPSFIQPVFPEGKGISTVPSAATAHMAYAAGQDKVFPEVFAKIHPKYNTPYVALIISAVLTNILLVMNYTQSLLSAFNFMILLATLAYLPIYASTAAAEILLLIKIEGKISVWRFITKSIIPLLGFAYAVWAIYGSGAEAVMYGFLLMLFGVPFYLYMKLNDQNAIKEIRNFEEEKISA